MEKKLFYCSLLPEKFKPKLPKIEFITQPSIRQTNSKKSSGNFFLGGGEGGSAHDQLMKLKKRLKEFIKSVHVIRKALDLYHMHIPSTFQFPSQVMPLSSASTQEDAE